MLCRLLTGDHSIMLGVIVGQDRVREVTFEQLCRPALPLHSCQGGRSTRRASRSRQATRRGSTMVSKASGRDRKSTRLNSSHSQISYAVFCLKKKKKTA